MAARNTSRATRRKEADYWCHPQGDGHPTLYFHGHKLISRAEFVSAVGPDDCDPHIATGQRKARSERERRMRM